MILQDAILILSALEFERICTFFVETILQVHKFEFESDWNQNCMMADSSFTIYTSDIFFQEYQRSSCLLVLLVQFRNGLCQLLIHVRCNLGVHQVAAVFGRIDCVAEFGLSSERAEKSIRLQGHWQSEIRDIGCEDQSSFFKWLIRRCCQFRKP